MDRERTGPGDAARGRRLRSADFGRLLAVYPAARPFWALVLGALAVSVALHLRRLRREERARGAPAQDAGSAAGLSSGGL